MNINNLYDYVVTLMDDEIRESVHAEYAPCSEVLFIKKYIQADPAFGDMLDTEFNGLDNLIDTIREISILKSTGLTDKEAVDALENDGCIIYLADDYILECGKALDDCDEDDAIHLRRLIEDIESATKDEHLTYDDGSIVIYDDIKYYVNWIL